MALGQEANTSQINEPGLYRDPVSEKELEVTMHAGADALVRMGWVRISEGELETQTTADVPLVAPKADTKKSKG